MVKKIFLGLIFLSAVSFGAEIIVPDGDPTSTLMELIRNWMVLAPVARAAIVLVLVIQGVKRFMPGFIYLRALTIFGGVLYAFLQSVATGMSLVNAAVFALITSGGAMTIYQYFKGPLNKAFGVDTTCDKKLRAKARAKKNVGTNRSRASKVRGSVVN